MNYLTEEQIVNIQIMSYEDCRSLEKREPAYKHNKDKYTFERWSGMRKKLIEHLSKKWMYEDAGCGIFCVGEDWFESGVFGVTLLEWQFFQMDFLTSCQSFLGTHSNYYLITVGKSFAVSTDYDFSITITATNAYANIYNKSALESYKLICSDQVFYGIKSSCTVSAS